MLRKNEKRRLKRQLREELEDKLVKQFEEGKRGDRKTDRRKLQLIEVIRKLRQ